MYKTIHAWAFLAPAGLLLLLFSILPAAAALYLSFTSYNVFEPMEWTGLANYRALLGDPEFWRAMFNTFYYWLLVTPALVILPVFLAILVNQALTGVKIFRLIYYFPALVSVVVTAFLWGWMFQSEGIFNYMLSLFGAEPVKWLTSKYFVMPSLAIVTVWQGLGYYMLFYLAGLQAVPEDLYEAAELDGAGFWSRHIRITFPMLKPVVFFVSVVSTMGAFKEFTLMLTMTEGGPIGASTTVVYMVFDEAFKQLDMGYASAVSFVLFVVILLLTLVNKRSMEGE
ncbi:carbohydrate ABC transporter permease [Paenibacillus sp. UNC499MF]|uniref:carbohydrate ABC transporter permease n=1 Tax=Paenibacillus sp. UNC499MF TaxID=1502751 RepID=UPI0008A09A05|nr:sugar ABC transporter permease [Paenibacillus sp. UNC499MF]SEF66252.1 putative chitobiose transport system permease protein [Paenibacillus sp. UNC499MF]